MSDFDEYIRQGEPGRIEKATAWKAAIGLQDVDGLKPSAYLVDTAKRHIEGDITIHQVKGLIDSYYKSRQGRLSTEEERTEEADKVSARITELLQEDTFSFTPAEYQRIHRKLFAGIFKSAGKYRDYNISKKEWVLDGASVLYNPFENLKETMDYDFAEERKFDYASASTKEAIRHVATFIAGIWQIHPFGEGNTRTTAVFLIKYLRSFGFAINNDLFSVHSWYFRNALVRANYSNREKGISPDMTYLENFLRNLVLGEDNELKNRHLHISYHGDKTQAPKGQIDTLNVTLEERAVLNCISQNNRCTQKEIALAIGKSERTVKRIMASLSDKRIIIRKNGKRNGYWELI
jgi:fido (protein-threonine AMPylation protein)/DNA-binding CsgD family transcriptional regulator